MFDVSRVRDEFPQTRQRVRESPLVYLDSAATSLKPKSVIDIVSGYYTEAVANIHRGAHFFGDLGTTRYEAVREQVGRFLCSASPEEIVFTRGTTEGINLVAHGLGLSLFKPGDRILLTEMEHHSNLVPWHLLSERLSLKIDAVEVTPNGELDLSDYRKKLRLGPKLVSIVHCSNALGTINPIGDMIREARAVGALTLIDAAQSVVLQPIDVQKLGCDFLVFSGHKIYAPTGIGVLYGKKSQLLQLPPYQGGGSMIKEVRVEQSTYLEPPHRFEAGTPHIAGVLGLGAALEFVSNLSWADALAHKKSLLGRARSGLSEIKGLQIIGGTPSAENILSFVIQGTHPSDIGHLLDQQGLAVRAGHHCCQPLMSRLGISGTVRASFSVYNTEEDVDRLVAGVAKAKEILL